MDGDYKKLAQLCAIIETYSSKKEFVLGKFVQSNAHVLNCHIPENKYFKLKKPDLIGDTPLHFALKKKIKNKLVTIKKLIELGADFTIKNGQGETVFHQVTQRHLKDHNIWEWKKTSKLYFVDTLLSGLVNFKNTANPTNNDGISHFHITCMLNHTKAVELFLSAGVSVDQAVNFDSPILPGYTPLHFAAKYFGLETVQILLQHGASVHLKDAKGMSALHVLIDHNMILADMFHDESLAFVPFEDEDYLELEERRLVKEFEELKIVDFDNTMIYKEKFDLNNKMIRLFIEWDNTEDCKVIDDTGLSNLHTACCLRDFSTIKRLLKSVTDLDHCVNMDSHIWPGYTALHFAAHFDVDIVKFLLSHGANILAKDATGTTPLDLCIAKYNLHEISSIINSQADWKGICFSDSKTKLLDFISSIKEVLSFESFLKDVDVNIAIPRDSTLWPGYTLLHLSITLCQRDADENEQKIKKLLALGADVTIRDARGWTPLHLALQSNKLSIVDLLLEQHPANVNPVDKNGFSHLHIACIRKKNAEKFINGPNINSSVKNTFTIRKAYDYNTRNFHPELHIIAGSTPLHVACVNIDYYSTKVSIELIEHGADVCSRDIDGFTPLHHAFMRRTNYGWDESLWKKIFSLSDLENCVADCGLSHLHIACSMRNTKAVERMLDLGADVNAMITHTLPKNAVDVALECATNPECNRKIPHHPHDVMCFLKRFNGYTPLEFALDQFCDEVVLVLLHRGADVLVKKPDGAVLLKKLLDRMRTFFPEYKKNENMQRYIEKETGLTMLHLACGALEFNDIVKSLDRIDVNSCAHSDSPVWPGCTPLHVLVMKGKCSCFDVRKRVCQSIELLIAKGANVGLQNAEQKTPLHEIFDRSPLFENGYPLKLDLAILILKNNTNYDTNPVDTRGVSHFHIACLCNDETAVKKFLEHGVDINQPIDYFVESCGGYTPLHLAAIQKSRETISLLLRCNADVNAKNLLDESPLQTIAFRKGIKKEDLEFFIRHGAPIDDRDLFGETPLESLIREYENDKVSFIDMNEIMETLKNYQCRVNAFYAHKQLGFMGGNFRSANRSWGRQNETLNPLVQAAINAPDLNCVDFLGRSVIHNIVSAGVLHETDRFEEEYIDAIVELAEAGFDIDHQDNRGHTPLHTAAHFKHASGIKALLMNGADWNLTDKNGKPAYAYLGSYPEHDDDFGYSSIHDELYVHFKKLQILKLHISSANQDFISQEPPNYIEESYTDRKQNKFHSSLCDATFKTIEPYSIKLRDFLSETGAVSTYAFKSLVERETIDNFFRNNHAHLRETLPELVGILYLQYRKAVARKDLIEPANISMSILSGYDLPHLCSEAVLKFLSNDELKNLIDSTNDE